MQHLAFTLSVVAPVFLIVGLGYVLKSLGVINRNFVTVSTQIVFLVSLPILIFLELSVVDFRQAFDIRAIGFIYAGTLVFFGVIWLLAGKFIPDGRDRGAFIQGSFRGNFAIIGLALISNMFGSEGLSRASLMLAFIIPLYNVLAVIALAVPNRDEKELELAGTLLEILKNPLIIAVIISVGYSLTGWGLHPLINNTAEYLARIALPLALLGIGGSLNFQQMREASVMAILSAGIKLIVIPAGLTYGAFLLGFRGLLLGVLFILFACPTAISSFVMAEAMDSNGDLAGNIVLWTTLTSVVTITIGLIILQASHLI
ncbi:MAG: AEC family transporter [Candidatus Marinimicrobia bacterium]|nr:AEC family transporter [Candidatus Neomarinimicrobiota bacterium]